MEDSTYNPFDENQAVLKTIAILDPASKVKVQELPCGASPDQKVSMLAITTAFTLSAKASGQGIVVYNRKSIFKKLVEHWYKDNVSGDYVLDPIVITSVKPGERHVWARMVKEWLTMKSGYLVTNAGSISAGTQGDISGAEVPSGLSQMYQTGLNAVDCINYSALSQLQLDGRSKLIGSTAKDGIAFMVPVEPRLKFIRTSDNAGGSTTEDIVDFQEPIIVNGEATYTTDIIPAAENITAGGFITHTSDSVSVDIPFHADIGANIDMQLTFQNIANLAADGYFSVVVNAILYGVDREATAATIPIWKDTVNVRNGLVAGSVTRFFVRNSTSVVWPTIPDDELHGTITAIKYQIIIYNLTSSTVTVNYIDTHVFAKIVQPMFADLSQKPIIIAYQNFSEGAPITCMSTRIMEAVPDAELSKLIQVDTRKQNPKETDLLETALRKMEKHGVGNWWKPGVESGPESLAQLSHEIKMIVYSVAYKRFLNKEKMLNEFKTLLDSYPVVGPTGPQYSSGFSRFMNKMNKKVFRPTGKAFKSLGEELWNVSKPVAREFVKTGADALTRQMLPTFASGGSFASGAKFASTVDGQYRTFKTRGFANNPKLFIPNKSLAELVADASCPPLDDEVDESDEEKEWKLLPRDFFKTECSDEVFDELSDCKVGGPVFATSFPKIEVKGDEVFVPINVRSIYAPNCSFMRVGNVRPNASCSLIVESNSEIVKKFNELKQKTQEYHDSPWTKINDKFILYGHVGPNLNIPGVTCHMAIITPKSCSENEIKCKIEEIGSGDSVMAALYCMGAIHCSCNMNIAVSGAINGGNLLPIDDVVARWKLQACENDKLDFVANSPFATYSVGTVGKLGQLINKLLKYSSVNNKPLFFPNRGRGRGGMRPQTNDQTQVRNQQMSQPQGQRPAPQFNNNQFRRNNRKQLLSEYVYNPLDFEQVLLRVASNKCLPLGRLIPCPGNIPFEWKNYCNELWSEFFTNFAQKNTKLDIKCIVRCWLELVVTKGLYVHSGFGYAKSKKENDPEWKRAIQEFRTLYKLDDPQ